MEKNASEGKYTLPKISTTDKKDWFIYFRFFHAGKWHLRKLREDLNRISDKKKRLAEANGLCEARTQWLQEGWNPLIDPTYKLKRIKSTEVKQQGSFKDAINEAFEVKKLDVRPKSWMGYRSQLNFILTVADTIGYSLLQVTKMDRGMSLDLMDKCKVLYNWSNHAYNKHTATLRTMYEVLFDRGVIAANPLTKFKVKDVPESNLYSPYTLEEKKLILKHLLSKHFNLYRVMQVIYHNGIRPKECLALRVSDIDMKARIITIAPDNFLENSKTNGVRRMPINKYLYDLLAMLKLEKYPKHYFVFGSPFIPGQGNRGAGTTKRMPGEDRPGIYDGVSYPSGISGAMRPDFLTPSPNQVKRDTITKLWKRLIIDELGVNKKLYAAKATGGDDKALSGLELKEIQYLYDHSSEAMTKRYVRVQTAMKNNKSILQKSPDFVEKDRTTFRKLAKERQNAA
jgi:integrase